ncbi:hypothetical protein [Mesorhizobium waimense]|uniref:hypothetical protein n=1 Tax=Mesorhizobium waimense TaxID=1300307 RepID=UPI00142D45FD|nr:hypothetical protein [Mesorhizobium waimense]
MTITFFFGGGTVRTTFGWGFATSGVGSGWGTKDVQPMSPATRPDKIVPMIACFDVLPTIASQLIKTRPDADWLLPRLAWPR